MLYFYIIFIIPSFFKVLLYYYLLFKNISFLICTFWLQYYAVCEMIGHNVTSKIPTFKNGNSGKFWANLWHLPRLWTCWNWAWIKTAKVSINWGQQRLDYIVPSYFEVKPGSSFSPRELWSLFDIWNHMTFSNSAQFKFGREIQLGFKGYCYNSVYVL